jgi:phenylacetate-CoA ligase
MNSLHLSLKYALRRAVHFNAYAVSWAANARVREQLSGAERQAHTDRALRHTLLCAAHTIPAYASLRGRVPAHGLAAFLADNVPVICKTDLQHERSRYYPNGGVKRPWWAVGKTSGTSGSPLDVFRSLPSIVMEQAVLLQHWKWVGFDIADRQIVLRGDLVVPPARSEPPFWFHDRAGRSLIVSTRHLNQQNIGAVSDAIEAYGAKWLRCYPSAGYELARLLVQAKRKAQFKGVITASEPVYPLQRELIEKTFGCRLFSGYGMAERVVGAAQCEEGSLHVNTDYSHVEVVDDQGHPTLGSGFLVGTTFHNSVMPLVRYRLDDTAQWSPQPCRCGRQYPVLVNLEGRVEDQLLDLNGNPVNSAVITFVFKEAKYIQRTQVAQVSADRWEIRIVPDQGYTDDIGQRMKADIARLVSPHLNVHIKCVERLDNLPSGKFKWVTQEWRVAAQPS